MFERYTEKARRVIFFARYEASQFGSPFIETEHLLLGIMRESKDLLHLFEDGLYPIPEIRKKIEEIELAQPVRTKVSTSVDLPLSNESKRVLAYAAEEAERLSHQHIGTEHLFLGLLREETTAAAKVLIGRGITLQEARDRIARQARSGAAGLEKTGITELHGAGWANNYLNSVVSDLKRFAWRKQTWKPRDILVEKQTRRVMFYAGEGFDSIKFELAQGGWKRDHCAVCHWPLYESDDPEHGVACTNGRDWICTECHDKFFAPAITPLDDLYT